MLYLLDDSGRAREKAQAETKDGPLSFSGMGFRPTGALGGWAVGATPVKLPEGLAYPLKKGSDFLLQAHFHLSGKVEQETITIGIHFAKTPPKRTLIPLQLPPAFGLFANINIPAGKADFKVQDSFELPYDVDVIGVGAHAHYIGKTLKSTAILPDKTEKKVFFINDWDFNWQGQYLYKKPFRLPKGTIVRSEITWDNSDANPRNPNSPPIAVRWGEGSSDEMGSVTLLLVPAEESDAKNLQTSIRTHVTKAFLRSRLRGDKIDFEQLGISPAQLRENLPRMRLTTPEKDAKPQSKKFQDLDGTDRYPLQLTDATAKVFFFVTTECPNANAYLPEINRIADDYAKNSIQCFLVHVDPELTAATAKKHAKEYQIKLPVLLDSQHDLVQATAVTHTPEAAILLPNGTIAYRGRIDDRFPELGKKELPRRNPSCVTHSTASLQEHLSKCHAPK
ncbi:MAG: redoxin domain-containing protein [Zavarzinella sp.]